MSDVSNSEKETALAAYNDVVERAELSDIKLIDLNFKIKPVYFDPEVRDKAKRSFNVATSNFFYDEETLMLGGMFEWEVKAEAARKRIFVAKAVYLVVYDNVPNVGTVHSEAFLTRVGRFATYPYFRSLVSQVSWASGAEVPIMPVLK